MVRKQPSSRRREQSLSRNRIIDAAIALLDSGGEGGLTFQALSEKLTTGPGAIYWHIANKRDLLTAVCDTMVERAINAQAEGETPEQTIRSLALGLFDAIDAHPWVGSALTRTGGQMPMVRIFERLGQQLRALGVTDDAQWATVSALMNYILGVGGQNAANAQFARAAELDRDDFLDAMATTLSGLDPDQYPFSRGIAGQLRVHDDRVDFLVGIDLILGGIRELRRNPIDRE
jgi:AcrR family transcriptional regulator